MPTDPLIHILQIADPAIPLLVHKGLLGQYVGKVFCSEYSFIVDLAAEC